MLTSSIHCSSCQNRVIFCITWQCCPKVPDSNLTHLGDTMSGQRIGYIRVSTLDQHTERQLDGIEIDKTFIDKASRKDTKRPQLELMMSFVRAGIPSSFTAWTGLPAT